MKTTSHLSISDLLSLTAVFCLACVPLAKPSIWWTLLLPTFGALATVFAVSRFAMAPGGGRMFWACFVAGVLTYLGGVLLIGMLCMVRGVMTDFWGENLGMPAWRLLHGEEAFTKNRYGMVTEDLVSFMASLHVIIAMTVSATASFAAQFFAARRDAAGS